MDLIELRALHANDTTARRLQTEKEFIQIKLNSTQDELRAITAEYKRIFESHNAKVSLTFTNILLAVNPNLVLDDLA